MLGGTIRKEFPRKIWWKVWPWGTRLSMNSLQPKHILRGFWKNHIKHINILKYVKLSYAIPNAKKKIINYSRYILYIKTLNDGGARPLETGLPVGCSTEVSITFFLNFYIITFPIFKNPVYRFISYKVIKSVGNKINRNVSVVFIYEC
jgi:hypothetical protein